MNSCAHQPAAALNEAARMNDLFVNGVQVLKNGKHTGAEPGRVVRGPGWPRWPGGGACR